MIKLNGKTITATRFPDNSSQVWKLDPLLFAVAYKEVTVTWEFQHDMEFIELAQLKTLLDHYGLMAKLDMPYLPYGRQDKPIANQATFGLYTFASLLNSLKFERVRCLDPHSPVAEKLINRFDYWYPIAEWKEQLKHNPIVCFPDKGAREKYTPYFAGRALVHGEKVRDQLTGIITSMTLTGPAVMDRNVLIIDDICDGGATFIMLAKALLEDGARHVDLFVSHGIFSKGTRILFNAGISRIFTPKGEVGPRFGDQQ